MIIYCIRHGQSTYNAEGRIQGQSDVPLSPLGRRQAEAMAHALAEAMAGRRPDAIFASPLRRALETARPLADRFELPLQTDPRLKEIHAGVFQDRIHAEIEREYPGHLPRWRSGDLDYRMPGGESRRELIRRGKEALLAIRRLDYREVCVVAHGGVLLAAMKAVLGIASEEPPLTMKNASISKIVFNGKTRVMLEFFDRIDHLEGLSFAEVEQ